MKSSFILKSQKSTKPNTETIMKNKFQFTSVCILVLMFIGAFTVSTKAICTVCPQLLPQLGVWIVASRPDGQPGSGTLLDPYDGSTAAKFDSIMQSIPEN